MLVVAACTTTTSDLGDFKIDQVDVGDLRLTVAVADTDELRSQGLMDVEQLPSDLDGMLFVYPIPVSVSFHMLNTPMDLDIWWFDGDGVLIGTTQMEPCPGENCVNYRSPGQIRWALETPLGEFDFPSGAVLSTG